MPSRLHPRALGAGSPSRFPDPGEDPFAGAALIEDRAREAVLEFQQRRDIDRAQADLSAADFADADNDFYDDQDDDVDEGDPVNENLPPPGLKEISSLASWTVSSSKQGCGVDELRSADTSLFWQSDGPQPHTLSIHFFKLVSIAHMRLYLDHENDESYTPTRMQFWAGMGIHDLQEFAEMTFEAPKGWIDVDFSKVGPVPADADDSPDREIDWSTRPVLRAFLVQVRIIENHQNGKDTHLRGLQIFARDQASGMPPPEQALPERSVRPKSKQKSRPIGELPFRKAPWMMDPELR